MNFYLLTLNEGGGYDRLENIVVVAFNAAEARKLAAAHAGDEGAAPWLNEWTSTVKRLEAGVYNRPTVILKDFHAG